GADRSGSRRIAADRYRGDYQDREGREGGARLSVAYRDLDVGERPGARRRRCAREAAAAAVAARPVRLVGDRERQGATALLRRHTRREAVGLTRYDTRGRGSGDAQRALLRP